MKLNILLFIMVAETICESINDGEKNTNTDKALVDHPKIDDVGENGRTQQFGERISGKKGNSDANRHSTGKLHSDQNNGGEVRSKRGHKQRSNISSTSHFVIGGHRNLVTGNHNNHRVAGTGNTGITHNPFTGNRHGISIPVFGPSSIQVSSLGPLIKYGSATLTRTDHSRKPSGSSSVRKHYTPPGENHHRAGIKDPKTIKRLNSHGGYSLANLSSFKTVDSDVLRKLLGDGYDKNGPYSHSDGYSPGTGYYYGK